MLHSYYRIQTIKQDAEFNIKETNLVVSWNKMPAAVEKALNELDIDDKLIISPEMEKGTPTEQSRYACSDFAPVTIKGEPLSETIIKERR